MTNSGQNNSSKNIKIVPLRNKDIRSKVLKKYLWNDRTFCFSCGNAVDSLRSHNVNVIGVSERDSIKANKEIDVFESKLIFDCFDSTSAHLPLTLCYEISKEIRKVLPKEMFDNEKLILVPVGSGETLFCLSFIFPVSRLVAVSCEHYMPILFDMTPLKEFIEKSYKSLFVMKRIKSIKDMIPVLPYRNCYFIDTEPWKKE